MIALIQHPPVFLNLAESVEKSCLLIEEAAANGADIIVFPETWLSGYPIWLDLSPRAALWDYPPAKALYNLLVQNSLDIPSPQLKRILDSAHEAHAYVTLGAHELRGNTLYNTMIFMDGDAVSYQLHRKLIPTYTERMIWGRGDGSTLKVFPTKYGPLGGLICWEHWMPLVRAAMHAQHENIHVAQWPWAKELHHLVSRHYAFEGQCFVLVAGCALTRGELLNNMVNIVQSEDKMCLELLEEIPGGEGEWVLKGGSAVIAPDSTYVKEPLYDETKILYGDIDLTLITEGNLALDTSGHYSRPDIFQLRVNDSPQRNVVFTEEEKEDF
jgi:predicted amidohydrolase